MEFNCVKWCGGMLGKFAKLIVDYCVSVREGDDVKIAATYEAMPLIRELWREVVIRGAYPRLDLIDEVLDEIFYMYAPESLLKHLSVIDRFIAENVSASISVVSNTHTKYLINVDPERLRVRSQAVRELTEVFMRRDFEGSLRWVVTLYPTKALAQEAGMSLITYEDFVFRALKLYEDDPVSAWVKQAETQVRIVNYLSRVSELRIVSDDTDLTLRVDGRRWINDDGRKNMPGGEVFTSPIEDCVDGYIVFTYPAVWRGVEVEGVRLVFKRGEVVEASATKGCDFLRKMISVDEGSRRVGELAFGLNYDIGRFTKQILFDEKIGGTIHLALGAAYLGTGGENRSSIHWDMVKDLRNGRVYADGELIYENGMFLEEVVSD